MTKVMKLRVTFDGNYGGDVDETVILPIDVNGVLFEELEEGYYDRAIGLGEREGKHSECYGDLTVEFVNLDDLNIKQVAGLINESYFGEVEGYFESVEDDFSCEGDDEGNNEDKVNELLETYGVEKKEYMWGLTSKVYDKFIEQLKEKYVQKFKSITVLESDYATAIETLERLGVETFE